jgi:hypothetical protein
MTEQLPEARVQLAGENDPPLVLWKLTVPVGATGGEGPVSWTRTVQVVVIVGAMNSGLQLRLTETGLGSTCTLVVPDPPLCTESPE